MANRMVGYFENWAQYRQAGGKFLPDQINPSLFTHINFAFGLFGFVTWSVDPTETRAGPQRYTGDYTIQPVEWNDQTVLYPALQALKQQNGALKTLLSIGGWSMNSGDDMPNSGNPHPYGPYTHQLFSKMAADPPGRTQFIGSAIAYAQKYGFDGIDIDWEYPGYISRGGDPNDLANFLALVQEFRATAGAGFLLTMAAPAIVPTGLPQTYHDNPSSFFQWLQQCSQSLDWLNIMSYDYHGAFDDPVKIGTGVNSPLVQDSTPNGPFSIKQTVDAYRTAGIAADKMVLGMPTYGRSYTVANPGQLASNSGHGQQFNGAGPAGPATQVPGVLAYYEIKQQIAAGNLTRQWDAATLTPYAYNAASGEWVSYDNEDSLAYKTAYVNAISLGGAMVWSIDNDDFANGSPLATTIKGIVGSPQLGPQLPSALLADSAPSQQTWMARLPDTLKLSELTIPGTHESCARLPEYITGQGYNWGYPFTSLFVDCQDWPLQDQLNHGIRYIDIRCRRTQDVFAIHHAQYYMGFNFGAGVRDVCVNFLKSSPTECIVMQILREYDDDSPTQTFEQVFDGYVRGFESFFYLDDHIPTLGEVRGKIVVVRRFSLDQSSSPRGLAPLPWADNATFPVNYQAANQEAVSFKVQDQYHLPGSAIDASSSIDSKWNAVSTLLDQAKSDSSGTWYINEVSGENDAGVLTPRNIATGTDGRPIGGYKGMNSRLYNYLAAAPFPNRLGALLMDFPDDTLIGKIISLNMPAGERPVGLSIGRQPNRHRQGADPHAVRPIPRPAL